MTELLQYLTASVVFTALNYIVINIIVKSAFEKAFENRESETIERCRRNIKGKQQELDYYKSRCYGAEKKISLLEEEITKLRTKK